MTKKHIKKYEHRLSDGRQLIYYDDADTKLGAARKPDGRRPAPRPETAPMRQDPLTGDWVSVAVARQTRAFLPPAEFDPLAPQCAENPDAEIPSLYDVAVFENKSPAFGPLLEIPTTEPPQGLAELGTIGLGREFTSVGRCEVVCFTPEKTGSFDTLSPSRARTVIEAWADRTAALSAMPNIQQVFPFENRGEVIGVTLHHPHGQIYAYPYIPPRTQALIASLDRYGPFLFAGILQFERSSGDRVVLSGEHWTAFVPFAARWPVEVHILPHRHIADLAATSDAERDELATFYLRVLRGIDGLYEDGTPTPYIAAWHQAAMGAWVGDVSPELGAKRLREAIQRADAANPVGKLPEEIGGLEKSSNEKTGRPDIFDLLSNIAETVQNKGRNNVPKHLPPALPLPRAIDIKRVPFTLPSGTENIRAMRRCQFSNGTLWPSATDCDDELGSGACETIFFELSDLARRCAKTCAFCCETPQFNCMDSGGTVIDCAAHKTKCKEPSWRRVMMSMCEHTCGLCVADACFDAADDCSSLGHLCFHQAVSPLVRQQCARSCGLCTPQQRAETAPSGAESREVVGVQKTPKEVIVLVRKNSQIIPSTASPKSAICQDVSPSCADNSGLCTDKIYSDFLKDKCAKTCGHCLTEEEDKVRLGNDYDSDSSNGEDYDQPFESVRRIRNRPSAAPPAGGQNNSPDNGTTVARRAKESSSRRIKSSEKFSERLIIKIGGGDQKEHIELRGKLGETLRISREILLENDEENNDDQAEKKKRKRQKKKQRNLSPLLVILEKAQPNEAEEALPEERGNGFREVLTFPQGRKRNRTEIVWTSEETKKEENNAGEIAYGQRQKKKLEKQRESNERENSEKEKELRIERESNGEEEEEAEKRGKSVGRERNGDRQGERMGARLKNNERLPKNERQTDSERIRENNSQKDNERTRENERQIDNRLRENERQIDSERRLRENERQIDNERLRENERLAHNKRLQENERQIDSMMVEVGNKTTDQNGRNRINSEQLHVGQFTAAKGQTNNRIESDASLLRKSTPKEKAKAEKKQTNDQKNEREVITDEQMGVIKQPSDRISEWTRRNPKEEAPNGGKMPNGRILWTKILPVQTSASNKSLPNSADKENIPPTTDGRSLRNLSGDRPFSPKQLPTDEQKKSDGQKEDSLGGQQRTSDMRTKAGNSELSQRILQLLKNLRIAKEAVANYGTGRRRRRKRSAEKIADQKQGRRITENGQEMISDQKSDKKLTDQGQAPLPGQQNVAITGQDFRERLREEKPPDEKKAEEKGTEEEAKLVVEELITGQSGEKADKLEEEAEKLGGEEGILDGILVEEDQKEREEAFGAVPEGMVDELVEQQLLKREKDGTKAFVEVIRAVLEEIGGDVLFAGEEEQNQIEEAQQGAQKVPKMREDTAGEEGEEADDQGNENTDEQQMPEVIGSDQLVFGDQQRPSIREDDNDGIDQPLSDQQTINTGALPNELDKSLPAADAQNDGHQFQEAAKAPKLAEFDQENGEENAGSYGRTWNDQSLRINDRPQGNSDEFGTRQADDQQQGSSRKMFDGVLRDRGGRAVRVEDLPGGISGALERVRLRYGFGNGTMEEMLANLLLDTERDIANGLKQILGELKKLEGPAERQRKVPIFNNDNEDEKERRKNKMRKFGRNGKRGGKSGSDEESDKDAETSERERKGGRETERNSVMSREEDKRRNSAISREDRRKKNGERNKGANDQQADQTLRQLLKLLVDNINKKSSDPSSTEKNLMALANKKRGQRKAAEVPILDELVELIKKQRTTLDRRKEQSEESEDNWGKAKKKPKPQLSSTRANNRRRRILTAPTRAASSVQSRGPAKTLVLPRRVRLPSAGGPTPDGYRLVPIIGPAGNQMPSASGQVYANGQLGNFLPQPTGANGGPSPVYSLPLPQQQQQREGQAVPAAQPQQVPMQPAKQAVVWQQPVYVQFPQQIQQQQTQRGQQPQQFPQQQQQQVQPQQPQTVYVQQQPAQQQLQAVPAPLPPPQQQPQIVVQRPAQPPQQQQQFLLPNQQQQPQQNLVVADAAAPAGGMPRAPLLQQPTRVSSSSSSRGSYVMLRKNAIGGGNNIVGPKCRDYYPYCEQIVPRGFCISEVYPLRMKREYCPQSCGLC
ncbi:hypothetical protein niasHT_020724 [Heterodera trifolii]|uniref:UDP-glucose--hexose-1-phosphate uridylyltransferase n=1 Tax=Heterodera trifolii TaxID=157864 RepID=A0ABD2KM82_9BILA